jgi:predicted amidohydrolase
MTIVGVGQLDVSRGDVDANLGRCLEAMDEAARAGAALLVLPECALTGYMYHAREEVAAVALDVAGAEVETVAENARRLGVTTVVGLLEADDDRLYNTAAMATADGRVVVTRKTHLPMLGADRFVSPGAALGPVVTTSAGCIGVAICYDFRFPEVCRSFALAGAELIAVPVNWSDAVGVLAEHFVPVRAIENRVAIAVANRADAEDALRFPGGRQIVGPGGQRLAGCGERIGSIEIATAAVELDEARCKATVFEPGAFEFDVFDDRRPSLYHRLVEEQRDG